MSGHAVGNTDFFQKLEKITDHKLQRDAPRGKKGNKKDECTKIFCGH